MKDNEIIKDFFKRSKKQKGKLYVCQAPTIVQFDGTSYRQWKYGKTKDITRRMAMYGNGYNLLQTFEVDHLSLREELIRNDWSIQDDRRFGMKDARDEHVDFNPTKRVDLYAKCKIELYQNEHFQMKIRLSDEDGEFCTRGMGELLRCFQL